MSIRLLALAFSLVLHPAAGPAQEPAGTRESFNDLTRRLEAADWTPPYFAGKVALFDFRREEQLLRPALGEPFELVPVGKYSYRTSPRRAEVGKRLFELYDWGTAQIWRSNERYFHYALGVSTAEDLESLPQPRRKKGAGAGHNFGMGLPPEDREALIAFLKSL